MFPNCQKLDMRKAGLHKTQNVVAVPDVVVDVEESGATRKWGGTFQGMGQRHMLGHMYQIPPSLDAEDIGTIHKSYRFRVRATDR
jgi:hypothetical protein